MGKPFFDNLANKTVIVAGGEGLIGSAIVKGFRDIGTKTICADIRGDGEYFDMAEPETIKSILEKYRPVHGFVNCTYPKGNINYLNNLIAMTLYVAIDFAEQRNGSIVNFGSIYGCIGFDARLYRETLIKPPKWDYLAAKGAIIQFSKTLGVECGFTGVRCNVVSPGGIFDNQDPKFVERYNKKVPMGRMANPEDIVGIVMFLISDWSKYITGQNILVDGGLTAW